MATLHAASNPVHTHTRRRVLRGLTLWCSSTPWLAATRFPSANAAAPPSADPLDDFPTRALTFIVPWAAGGGGDVAVRMLAHALSERTGHPIVVKNHGGATGTIGSAVAARSKPDGYTVVYATADSHFVFPHLYQQVPYDPLADFAPVAPIGYFQFGLAVHPSFPARDAQEFLARVRAAPGRYSYGTWGVGSTAQLITERYKTQHALNILHVPYLGTAPELLALVSGQVDAAILPMQILDGYVNGGQIRLLGLGSPERYETLPDLLTLQEQGMDIDYRSAVGFLAPVNVPPARLAWLNRTLSDVMRDPAVQHNLRTQYILSQVMTPAQYQAFLHDEYQRWGAVVRDAGVTLE